MSESEKLILSTRQSAYVEAFIGVIIALAGNALTTDNPTKECHTVLYTNCVSWVWDNSNRLNIELKDEIEKRQHILEDYFTIQPIDDQMLTILRDSFPKSPTEADTKRVYSCWEACKRDCKNTYAPPYIRSRKERLAGYQSGTYNDSDSLHSILKKEIIETIDDNFRKAMNAIKNNLAKDANGKSEAEQKEFLLKEENTKSVFYSAKKTEWKKVKLPKYFLAFILLGSASNKDLPALTVGSKQSSTITLQQAKGATGRRALREAKAVGGGNDDQTPSTTSNHSSRFDFSTVVKTKKRELVFKSDQAKLANYKELLAVMGEDEEMKKSERYKRIRSEYMDELEKGIAKNDYNEETIDIEKNDDDNTDEVNKRLDLTNN